MTKFALIAAVVAGAAAFGMAGTRADAATFACNSVTSPIPDVTSYVTGTSGCEFSNTLGNDNEADVNAEAFFGFNDWTFVAKDNDLDGTDEGDASALTITGNQQSGSWSILSMADTDYMLIFKGGNLNNTVPGAVIGYLLSATSGLYQSPLLNDSNFNPRNISHVSLYSRDNGGGITPPDPIPLPAAAWLLLSGIGGLGVMGWRKRRADA